jgi:hypothetical protein
MSDAAKKETTAKRVRHLHPEQAEAAAALLTCPVCGQNGPCDARRYLPGEYATPGVSGDMPGFVVKIYGGATRSESQQRVLTFPMHVARISAGARVIEDEPNVN